ncbi:MAG TPA: sugar ABC transporter permease [bacterium]|nr:sugar ABC transporter permease [bacterium]
MKLKKREAILGYFYISPWLIGFLIFVAGPMIASLYFSFCDYQLLIPPKWIGINNYVRIFSDDPLFMKSLWNTLYYTVGSVILGVIGSLILAVLLNQRVRGETIFRSMFYLPTLTPAVAMAILWGWLFNTEFGLINRTLARIGIQGPAWLYSTEWVIPSFIIMSLWGIGGSRMIILLAGLQGIPQELYDAAEVDGVNWWTRFRYVTFPLLSPSLFFVTVTGIISSFQVFTTSYIMTSGGPANASLFYVLYLYRNAFEYFKMGYASALAWILFIIVIILTLLQFRLAGKWVYYGGQ